MASQPDAKPFTDAETLPDLDSAVGAQEAGMAKKEDGRQRPLTRARKRRRGGGGLPGHE